jgi:hypothetical protein
MTHPDLNNQAERAEFEAWWEARFPSDVRDSLHADVLAFEIWQAARRAAPPALDAEGLPPRTWLGMDMLGESIYGYTAEQVRQAQRDAKALGYALGRGAAVRDYVNLGTRQRAPEGAPVGMVLVPVTPTPEMIDAFSNELQGACGSYFDWDRGGEEAYAAMLAAATQPARTSNRRSMTTAGAANRDMLDPL